MIVSYSGLMMLICFSDLLSLSQIATLCAIIDWITYSFIVNAVKFGLELNMLNRLLEIKLNENFNENTVIFYSRNGYSWQNVCKKNIEMRQVEIWKYSKFGC